MTTGENILGAILNEKRYAEIETGTGNSSHREVGSRRTVATRRRKHSRATKSIIREWH